jgi:hypothetical protein
MSRHLFNGFILVNLLQLLYFLKNVLVTALSRLPLALVMITVLLFMF